MEKTGLYVWRKTKVTLDEFISNTIDGLLDLIAILVMGGLFLMVAYYSVAMIIHLTIKALSWVMQ